MRGFRARAAAAIVLGLATITSDRAAGADASAFVVAQGGPPIQLVPPRDIKPQPPAQPSPPATQPRPEQAQPLPQPLAPAAPTIPALAQPEADPNKQPRDIFTTQLVAPDPDEAGLIGPAEGGFDPDLWRGLDRAGIEDLLAIQPGALDSRVLRDLARRLYLSRANMPDAIAGARSLIVLRIDRLLALGDVEHAQRLLQMVPSRRQSPIEIAEVETYFYADDRETACQRVRDAARQDKVLYWQRALAFCHAIAGDHARAALIVDLLREREGDGEATFGVLIDALASGDRSARIPNLAEPTGLMLSLLRAAKLKAPADAANARRPAALRALALAQENDADFRIAAAERALVLGAFTAAELIELHAAVTSNWPLPSNPLVVAGQSWVPTQRAMLARVIASETRPEARAELLRSAFALGREKGGYEAVAAATIPALRALAPALDHMILARSAVRLLIAAGEVDRAREWIALFTEARGSAEHQARGIALWPYAALTSGGANGIDVAAAASWFAADGSTPTQRRLVAGLLDALEVGHGEARLRSILDRARVGAPTAPSLAAIALRGAAREKRIGEVVALVLVLLGEPGLSKSDPTRIANAVAALYGVGLEADARALALDAIAAAGI